MLGFVRGTFNTYTSVFIPEDVLDYVLVKDKRFLYVVFTEHTWHSPH